MLADYEDQDTWMRKDAHQYCQRRHLLVRPPFPSTTTRFGT
ncbi:MAG: hypothetical protein ACLTYW_07260 [Collinsella sp.]